jgi:ABC-type multidrug transport system fused ATPase/permease subunit
MFIAYVERFFAPVHDLSEKFDIMQSATAAGEKLITVFNDDAVKEVEGGSTEGARTGGGRRERGPAASRDAARAEPRFGAESRLRGEVLFEDVWFSYQPSEWVLRGVSFAIKPRQTLAIVGETGAGKTTVINLLSRFYRIQRGRILIDGVSIDDIPYRVLRENIASVMQDVFLFSRTVRDNITLGEPFDEEWFNKVCGVTHVDRFISNLPKLDLEMVMERGATFSAGERQLVSFARALYSNPSILVLDEATSNIDTETETLIRDAIAHLTKGRTSIVIAHRLSTIKNADTIIVLDKGTVVEEGRHEELLAKRGIYHKLYTLQFNALMSP